MPMYSFYRRDGSNPNPNPMPPIDLRDAHHAQIEASRVLSQMLHDQPQSTFSNKPVSIDVTDEVGKHICSVSSSGYAAALAVDPETHSSSCQTAD